MEDIKFLNGNKYRLDGCYIELTSRCNLRCKHCYNDSGELKEEISEQAFQNILNCYDRDIEPYISFSGGEPLLHPQIWDFADMAIESGVRNILMISNATLITKEIAKKIKDRNISMQISINSTKPELHNAMCGEGSLQKTMIGLENLREANVEKILVRYTVTQINKDDFVNTVESLADKGLFNVLLGAVIEIGRAKSNTEKLALTSEERAQIGESLENDSRLQKLKEKYLPKFQLPTLYTGGCPLILPEKEKDWVEINPRIDSAGNVYLCQSFSDVIYSVGNINDQNLCEIIKSKKFENLINFLYTGTFYMKECTSCVWKGVCSRGCVADCIQRGGIQETDGDCSFRKIDYAKKIIELSKSKLNDTTIS